MVGTHAGDMIGEIALAIEIGADAVDLSKTIPLDSTTRSRSNQTASCGLNLR